MRKDGDALESLLSALDAGLRERAESGLRRYLAVPSGVDFSSNDYLGLSAHPRIRKLLTGFLEDGPVGAPASRLMRGNSPHFLSCERRFARFKGTEAALLFPSGYQANLGLLTALVRPQDRVLSDERNHASIIDGLRLTGCKRVIYPHLDIRAVEAHLARAHPTGRTSVVTESLFSAHGDLAPLETLEELVRRSDALLIVDDAHATGVIGEKRGSGLLEVFGIERRVVGATSTGGKALGLCGAFVTGPQTVIDHICNHARSFIYTTAPLPLLAAGIAEAIEIVESEPWRRSQVHANAAHLRQGLRDRDVAIPEGIGPIVSVPIGDAHLSLQIAKDVQDHGYDVRALRPPTVNGGALLRISVHADHTLEQIEGVCDAVAMTLSGVRTGIAGDP